MSGTTSVDPHLQSALEEQIAYYRARAHEYDEWFLRLGRYNRGNEHTQLWFHEVGHVIRTLENHAPLGKTLELAGGTGLWSQRLANHSESLTIVDASAEMIEINSQRLENSNVKYIQHDIFTFRPETKYDTVFFSFWLSHVPSSRFEEFWTMVRSALKPGGKFFFLDSLKENRSTAVNHQLPIEDDSETLVRKLNDGREYRIFKLFYKPQELQSKLSALGFDVHVTQTETFFLYGIGTLREA